MRAARVADIHVLADDIWGIDIALEPDAGPEPGQFLMVWVPGSGEVPMSVSGAGKDTVSITVDAVGPTTKALRALKPGDWLGVKGPLGRGFDLSADDFLLVGGGTGIAPLAYAAEIISGQGKKVRSAIGARTAGSLLFEERLKACGEVMVATDDGTAGRKGAVTELAREMLFPDSSMILACGPEPMLAIMVELAADAGIPIQCSLERYMKCGLGVCGSCQIGKYRVCADGPVFPGELLMGIEEFGKWKRDASGRIMWF